MMENIYPFSKINMVPGAAIDNSPARCNRKTKELWLNADLWPTLSENTKDFIIYHEAGHIILQTTNEVAADEYAFQRMVKEGKSMRDCVLALTSLLTDSSGHRQRAYITLQRGKVVDELAKTIAAMESHYSNFSIGSKMKKQARKLNKVDKQSNKIGRRSIKREKKSVKNQGKLSRYKRGEDRSEAVYIKADGNAEAKTTLADMGIAQGSEVGGIVKDVAAVFVKPQPADVAETPPLLEAVAPGKQVNSIGSQAQESGGGGAMQNQFTPDRQDDERQVVKTKRQNAEQYTSEKFAPTANPENKKNNTALIIGAVAVVVVVLVALVLIFKNNSDGK